MSSGEEYMLCTGGRALLKTLEEGTSWWEDLTQEKRNTYLLDRLGALEIDFKRAQKEIKSLEEELHSIRVAENQEKIQSLKKVLSIAEECKKVLELRAPQPAASSDSSEKTQAISAPLSNYYIVCPTSTSISESNKWYFICNISLDMIVASFKLRSDAEKFMRDRGREGKTHE